MSESTCHCADSAYSIPCAACRRLCQRRERLLHQTRQIAVNVQKMLPTDQTIFKRLAEVEEATRFHAFCEAIRTAVADYIGDKPEPTRKQATIAAVVAREAVAG